MRNKTAVIVASASLVVALFAGGALTAWAVPSQGPARAGNPQGCAMGSCDQGPCLQRQQLRDGTGCGQGQGRGGFGQCGGGGCGAGQSQR